jgi:hypothetical protein
MMHRVLIIGSFLACSFSIQAQNISRSSDANETVTALVNSMPSLGGYLATSAATRDLQSAVQVRGGKLDVNPLAARTTYCSGATYLVFVQAIESILSRNALEGPIAEALAIKGQPDGVGIWGRWNANGPGTACLFRELNLGHNFTSFDAARRGDFMKIFWTGAVGRREHGHSVIYMGRFSKEGVEMIQFWSSNKPDGYGLKSVPRSRIAYAIFSRLEAPRNIEQARALPVRNSYLASLLTSDSSIAEAVRQSAAE